MKLSVCIDMVYGGIDPVKAMKSVKDAGYDAFEFWGWSNKDVNAIGGAMKEYGLTLAAMCTKSVALNEPSLRGEFVEGFKETAAVAAKLNVKTIIATVGNETDAPRADQHKSIVDGLKECAPIAEANGLTIVFEPLNTLVNHMGYYLWSADEAFEIEDEVGSPNIKILYDIYHQQIMDGNLIDRITKNISRIGHFHSAGVPGRNELYKGEINYTEVFRAIDKTDYAGYVGLEYAPVDDVTQGLKKIAALI